MIPFIKTNQTVTFTGRNGEPLQFTSDHKNADEMLKIIKTATPSEDVFVQLEELLVPRKYIFRMIKMFDTEIEVLDSGKVVCTVDGQPFDVDPSLLGDIVSLYDQNGDITPFIKFIRRLANNPRKEVADEIWGFLQTCGMTLTNDGCFLAYKNVNNDFTSVYDSKTDNSPGTEMSMRRSAVEHNPDRTCSSGLHFAAWGYLQHYAPGRKTVLLKIDPADVVSIPTDYNNMKGRACAYKVLREVNQPEELKNVRVYKD